MAQRMHRHVFPDPRRVGRFAQSGQSLIMLAVKVAAFAWLTRA
jgi:hypothetical protein